MMWGVQTLQKRACPLFNDNEIMMKKLCSLCREDTIKRGRCLSISLSVADMCVYHGSACVCVCVSWFSVCVFIPGQRVCFTCLKHNNYQLLFQYRG